MEILTPIKSIRAKCIDCCNGQRYEVKLCVISGCPLYPYRLGKRPQKDTISESEQDTDT